MAPAALLLTTILFGSSAAEAASNVRLYWDGLGIVVGKTVSIVMPAGAVITGQAQGLEPDALLVDIKKTTDRQAYPKGLVRIPRANVRVLEMRTKGKLGRIVASIAGTVVGGIAGALVVANGIWDPHFGQNVVPGATACLAAGVSGGYFLGNSIDTRWTTIEIAP